MEAVHSSETLDIINIHIALKTSIIEYELSILWFNQILNLEMFTFCLVYNLFS
jgi:hypothetical protein